MDQEEKQVVVPNESDDTGSILPSTFIIEHKGQQLSVIMPEVFTSLAKVLPIATKLFGSKKEIMVDSRDLHASLQVARNHSNWWIYAVKQYDLKENVDYLAERLDKHDPANWPAIAANGGKVPTTFMILPKVAAMIASHTKNEVGKAVWNYMYAVTDAAHDTIEAYYLREVSAKNAEIENKTRAWETSRSKLDLVSKQLGFRSQEEAYSKATFNLLDEEKRKQDHLISEKGIQAEALTRLVEQAAKYFNKCSKNPEKVKEGAEELLVALGTIQTTDPHYYSKL